MKTKLILLTMLMTSFTQGHSLISNLESDYITSSVTYDGSQYHYNYRSDSKINNRDISNITIELCDDVNIYDIYGDDLFTLEYKDESIKFDNIEPDGEEFIFGFYSKNSPELNDAYIKASRTTHTNQILSPSCQIPEPSILPLAFGILILARRRR